MGNDDRKFEEYLAEFEPRKPRALPLEAVSKQVWLRRFAAAAAIVISLGASMWFARKKHKLDGGEVVARSSMSAPEAKSQAPSLALVPLTQLALQDPEQFDARLIAASPTVLPDFGDSSSTLRVLAKE